MADNYTTGRGKPEAGMVWAERYKLEHQAGRGPGGMLWRAQCVVTQQTRALRILAESLLVPSGHERELRGVIARFSALRLPGVVAPEELANGPAGAAIVSAWIDGKNLAEHRLEAGGCLPADDLRRIAVQLARALVPLHRLNQVHGALRPANVFIDAAGSAVVGDTGSAWWVGEALMRLGNQSAVMAAMPYWSYERAMGDPASRADDIHAYGAILYELATGKTAVPANAFGVQATAKPPPPITGRRREAGLQPAPIDEDLDRLIIACLAREPSGRPASLESLLKALGEGAEDESAPLDTFQTMQADKIRQVLASAPPIAAAETVDPLPPPPEPAAVPDPAPVTVQEPVAMVQTVATPVTQPESRASTPAIAVPAVSATIPPAAAVVQPPVASPAPTSSIHYGEKKKKGSNGPVIVAGVVFAALAGVFIWYQTREPVPPAKTEATQPVATVRTLLDDLLDAVRNLPADAGEDAVTALQAKIAASLPNLNPEEQGRLQQAWQPRQQAFEQMFAAKRIGSIELTSTPVGAEVWSGSERLGVTPLVLKDRPAGKYAFELRLRGHVPLRGEVEVAGGRAATWQGALQRAKGVLRVESNASGDLFEVTEVASAGVVARGTTPQNLSLPAGEYRVAVERSGHKTLEQRVEVTGEAEARVEARFPEGRLKVEAPPGTMVSLGGVVRGMAPLELNLPAGEHTVTAEYPGGAKEERRVLITAAGQVDLKFQSAAAKPATVPVVNKPAETKADPVRQSVTTVDYNQVFELRDVTRQPVPVTQVAPTMPLRFRQRGVDGLVEISAVIDRFGSVQNIVVLRSSHVELNQATITAAGQWKFRPAEKDGRAVAVRVVLPFEFNLKGR